jgi:hypothetical protein
VNQFNRSSSTPDLPHAEALEGHVGLRMASLLSVGSESLPHDITERLRFSRERALNLALAQRRAAALQTSSAPVVLTNGRSAVLGGGPPSVWLRLASALPLLVLVFGLLFIQQHHDLQQIATAAEIDSALLADTLPPAAYNDPGFSEFLRTTEAP